MNRRCKDPKHRKWKDYGGRGIEVCERWRDSFEAFFADVGSRPAGMNGRRAAYSLERIDNAAGYAHGNVRWATKSEQSQNQRSNTPLTVRGQTLTVAEWSRRTGVLDSTIRYRMRVGRSSEDAIAAAPLRRDKIGDLA